MRPVGPPVLRTDLVVLAIAVLGGLLLLAACALA
jgi:hypothetical protein